MSLKSLLLVSTILGSCTAAFAQIVITAPTTITVAGSYKLGANLNVPSGANGVNIQASNVLLDLNGYVINGAGTGSYGIYVGTSSDHVTVKNGGIINFKTCGLKFDLVSGIEGGAGDEVEDVNLSGNFDGVFIYNTGTGVKNCTFSKNTSNGIEIWNSGSSSSISNCTFLGNTNHGITGQLTGSGIENCTFRETGVAIEGSNSAISITKALGISIIGNSIFQCTSGIVISATLSNGIALLMTNNNITCGSGTGLLLTNCTGIINQNIIAGNNVNHQFSGNTVPVMYTNNLEY